ncbi:MAG: tetratricopeptide repeat protein [Candidatus Cloacimonadales bacterium]|nr:tetratricopeptide repeat protein [Candidatus Cloacimonadales bacterium]
MKYLIFLLTIILSLGFTGCGKDSGINPLPNFDAMWDYSQPDSTEMRFKEILPLITQTNEFKVDEQYKAELLTQIARAQGMQGKFDEAAINLQQAENLIKENMPVAQIRYYLEKGRLLNAMGEKENAAKTFLKAYEYGLENKLDLYTIDAVHMLGIVEPPEKQIEWNLIAFYLVEKSEDPRCQSWLGALANNIGWTYFDLDDYDKALVFFQKGYDWRQTQLDEEATRIAKWSVARCLRALERYDDALQMQLELENEIMEKQLDQDGYVYEELAELYSIKNDRLKMQKYANLAYDLLSQDSWLAENQPERLERMKNLGK